MKRTIEEDLFGGRMKQPINQKQKGNRNELVVAKLLTLWTRHEFVRVPMSGGLRWKNSVNVCGDVISTDPLFDFPYSVETKHLKNIGINYHIIKPRKGITTLNTHSMIHRIWKQVEVDASRSDKRPMLLIRHNDMPEMEYFMFLNIFDPMIHKLADLRIEHKVTAMNPHHILWGYLISTVFQTPYNKLMR